MASRDGSSVAKAPAVKKSKAPVQVNSVEVKRDRFDWRSLYLYAICLITLLVCLFSVVIVIRKGVSFIYPDPGYFDPNSPATKNTLELARTNELRQSHHNSIIGMVDGFTTLIVSAPIYFYD